VRALARTVRKMPGGFTKNRQRLIAHDAVIELFNAVLVIAQKKKWLSGEHFSVDGTLIQAWAGHKSFRAKQAYEQAKGSNEGPGPDDKGDGEGGAGNFKGQPRSNDTHEPSTNADARFYRKGNTASEWCFMGNTLSDNRHGLIASAVVTTADGFAEPEAAKAMVADARQIAGEDTAVTLGAGKGYDAQEFIEALTQMNVQPHVAQNTSGRRSALSDSVAATKGNAICQQKRKLIEQGFGWTKLIGPIRQVMVRGLKKVDQLFVLTMAAYNLTRMRTLGQVRLQGT
jgi:hypothetical protein